MGAAARPAPSSVVLPIGRSPEPRPLFPDGARKVVAHTPVEDLLLLPLGEITELEPARALGALAAGTQCPRCLGPAAGIFFYVHGLAPVAADADLVELGTHGICGACGRRCTLVPDGRLGAF